MIRFSIIDLDSDTIDDKIIRCHVYGSRNIRMKVR